MDSARFAAAMFILATAALAADTRGVTIRVKNDRGADTAVRLYSASYALIIGVSDYARGSSWPDLSCVPGELDTIETALKRHHFAITRVTNPDGQTLKRAFDDFIDEYGLDEHNRLLFVYSGHGYTLRNGTEGFLVPTDAPDPREDEKGFRRKALNMTDILADCRKMQAKHALFLFDSCFSGAMFKTKALPDIPPTITLYTAKPVRQFITAGSEKEQVPAQSVFTPTLLKALRKGSEADYDRDGFVTGTELGMFLRNKVVPYSLERSTPQTPQYGKMRDPDFDEGDFVFDLASAESEGMDSVPPVIPAPKPPKPPVQATPGARAGQSAQAGQPLTLDLGGGVKMEFAWIEQGRFEMGSSEYAAEKPIHRVTFNKGFWMGKYEVTQAQWEQVMGSNPSHFKNAGDEAPVEQVSWDDCQDFIQKLNTLVTGHGFRLPTEAEWEYACRAGTATRFNTGDSDSVLDRAGWSVGNSGNATHRVGQKAPNAWGLHDMHGNVWEWCQDWKGNYAKGSATDPAGPPSGSFRVLRGGSWNDLPRSCRSAHRECFAPAVADHCYGFRVVVSR